MKYFISTLASLVFVLNSSLAYAESLIHTDCPEGLDQAKIELDVEIIKQNSIPGIDRKLMDKVILRAPDAIRGMPISKIIVSEGGVFNEKFEIPLAFKVTKGFAYGEFKTKSGVINNFSASVHYKSGACFKSQYLSIVQMKRITR